MTATTNLKTPKRTGLEPITITSNSYAPYIYEHFNLVFYISSLVRRCLTDQGDDQQVG